MERKFIIPFLVAMMLLTGVCNTLLTKYQDLQCVANCDATNTKDIRRFSQPVIQTAQMFIGEMGCWLVILLSNILSRLRSTSTPLFKYTPLDHQEDPELWEDEAEGEGNPAQTSGIVDMPASLNPPPPAATSLLSNSAFVQRKELVGWRIILLAAPACCDITGTTLMNVGLLFVAASIYQMTRGALVLFVGLFSVWFLKRRLRLYQWASLFVVVLGVALVGLAGAIAKDPQRKPPPESIPGSMSGEQAGISKRIGRALWAKDEDSIHTLDAPSAVALTVLGVLAIALAQTFTATQFVLEEHILEKYSLMPIKVVAWEGLFGFLITILGMIVLHYAVGRTPSGRNGYFDAVEGWREITQYPSIAISSILIMISIGGFNYFGLSITRDVSATARSIIDTCRTLFIWIVSLGLGWETFKWLQILGFALLVYGTFLFNNIVKPPNVRCAGKKRKDDPATSEAGDHGPPP